jgi:hypothetical protein
MLTAFSTTRRVVAAATAFLLPCATLASFSLAGASLAWAARPVDSPPAMHDAARPDPALAELGSPAMTLPAAIGDEVWVVSCRGLRAQSRERNLQHLQYSRLSAGGRWTPSDRTAFFASDRSPGLTTIFVPGNGYTATEARDLGAAAYARLVGGASHPSMRFVIWSWPSEPVSSGPVKDVRVKAARTTLAAWYLATWLDDLGPRASVSFVGTSFGARVVAEALQLRAGGRLGEFQVSPRPDRTALANVVFVSAAIDNDWLLPGRRLGLALSQVDRLLSINNTSDSILRRYRLVYNRRSDAVALGYAGLPRDARIGPLAEQVQEINASSMVGRRHGFSHYFAVPRIVDWMRPYVFHSALVGPAAENRARSEREMLPDGNGDGLRTVP